METDKKFVGSCKDGKYPDQVLIGLQRKDLDELIANINDRGWVNIRLSKSKAGKPYTEIIPP